jgi:hypothetical protein
MVEVDLSDDLESDIFQAGKTTWIIAWHWLVPGVRYGFELFIRDASSYGLHCAIQRTTACQDAIL